LDRINAGTIQIGDASSGPITISADITRAAATNIGLTSGGGINFASGAIDTAGGNLLLAPGSSLAANVTVPKPGTDVTVGANATLKFADSSNLSFAINGPNVDTQYDQLNVIGQVDLTGINLV